MQRSETDFLLDIKVECEIILKHSRNKKIHELLDDEILSRAIERSLEIIGEAAKQISNETKEKYNHIEWRKISGLRDIIIHQYFGVDHDLIWDIISNKIPELYLNIKKIIEQK